jgi:gamma-glutamylcysteine synthetase
LNNYTTIFEHTRTNHPEQLGGRIIIHPTSTEDYLEDSVNVLNIVPTDENKYDLLTFFASIRHSI